MSASRFVPTFARAISQINFSTLTPQLHDTQYILRRLTLFSQFEIDNPLNEQINCLIQIHKTK
jgi:hypothetical protein